MKIGQTLLVLVVVLGAGALGVEMMAPDGLRGMLAKWTGNSGNGTPGDAGPADRGSPAGDAPVGVKPPPRGNNAEQVASGQRAWDRGDFDTSVSAFLAARAMAGDDAQAAAAAKGLEQSILAWGVVQRPPRDVPSGDAGRTALARLVAEAEAAQTEDAWVEALRTAAALRAIDRMTYLATNALECARPGGPVERYASAALADAGNRAEPLRLALVRRGLSAPGSGGAAATAGDPAASGGAGSASGTSPERSGISGAAGPGLGVGAPAPSSPQSVPYGAFSAETRRLLAEAVKLEAKGKDEYALCAPDKPDRAKHAKEAVKALRAAQEVFSLAMDEDPKAAGLERRLRDITRMISDLKKSLPVE